MPNHVSLLLRGSLHEHLAGSTPAGSAFLRQDPLSPSYPLADHGFELQEYATSLIGTARRLVKSAMQMPQAEVSDLVTEFALHGTKESAVLGGSVDHRSWGLLMAPRPHLDWKPWMASFAPGASSIQAGAFMPWISCATSMVEGDVTQPGQTCLLRWRRWDPPQRRGAGRSLGSAVGSRVIPALSTAALGGDVWLRNFPADVIIDARMPRPQMRPPLRFFVLWRLVVAEVPRSRCVHADEVRPPCFMHLHASSGSVPQALREASPDHYPPLQSQDLMDER